MTTAVRQTRIFVPTAPPFDLDWPETVLGAIVIPAVTQYPDMKWFWFSRYVSDQSDSGDCDIARIPGSFAVNRQYRSIRFRYALTRDQAPSFEKHLDRLITNCGAQISDFRDYLWVDDLGGDRFLGGGDQSAPRRESRASLIVTYLHALSRVALDCIVGPDAHGRFAFEANSLLNENPYGSSFESLHHLFCNMTAVPTHALLINGQLGTHWGQPGIAIAGLNNAAIELRF